MFIRNRNVLDLSNYNQHALDQDDAKLAKSGVYVIKASDETFSLVQLTLLGKIFAGIAWLFSRKTQFIGWAASGKVVSLVEAKTALDLRLSAASGAALSSQPLPQSSAPAAAADSCAAPVSQPAQQSAVASKSGLKSLPVYLKDAFASVNSAALIDGKGKKAREDFLNDRSYVSRPPILSKSEFVPSSMAEHLMRNKKDSALGIKYYARSNDSITCMEGAMHTFLTPVVEIKMTGDYKWAGSHSVAGFNGQHRQVVMSAAIHPDFEIGDDQEVVMRLVEAKNDPVVGKELPADFKPLAARLGTTSQDFKSALPGYENELRAHMIYHLTRGRQLPSANGHVAELAAAVKDLVTLIRDNNTTDFGSTLAGKMVRVNGHVISLEALYNVYLNQIRNEFSVLEGTLPQGYVYLIDPPAIFARQIGGAPNASLLNRLQLLALKEVNANTPLTNLKVVGFNDFADKDAIALYKAVFPGKRICPKAELFTGPNGQYLIAEPYALVEHNNSDGFGQNIESEGPSSKDGILGCYSDAAHTLKRDRPDLVNFIV